jgi:hypothetical protein
MYKSSSNGQDMYKSSANGQDLYNSANDQGMQNSSTSWYDIHVFRKWAAASSG